MFCNDEQENWVLDYLTSGKGVLPYQMITDLDYLKKVPTGDSSSFSGCVLGNKNKCNIVLPTDAKKIRVFENTLIGGYSCVNTRAVFDAQLFLKNKHDERVLFAMMVLQ